MTSASPKPPRALFVDALRLVAAVQMVQGHTLDALLAPAYRAGPAFDAWTFTRGLTSTTFLFTAGLSFVLASASSRDPAAGRRRRLRRALWLLALGYLMHAPLGLLFGTPAAAAWAEFAAVDVLQCIGASLLLMELLALAVVHPRGRTVAGLLGGALLFLAAGPAAQLPPDGPARVLLNYVTPAGGSLFPLVPWTGYVLVGFAVGSSVLRTAHPARLLAVLALGTSALGLALAAQVHGADPRTAPGFLVLKLGLVLGLAAFLAWALARVPRLPPLLATLSGETLFLYVSHVLVLYAGHVGVKARWGGTLGPLAALFVAALLLTLCSAGALAYRRAERALRGARQKSTSAP